MKKNILKNIIIELENNDKGLIKSENKNIENYLHHECIEVPSSITENVDRKAYWVVGTKLFYNINPNKQCSFGPKVTDLMTDWAERRLNS